MFRDSDRILFAPVTAGDSEPVEQDGMTSVPWGTLRVGLYCVIPHDFEPCPAEPEIATVVGPFGTAADAGRYFTRIYGGPDSRLWYKISRTNPIDSATVPSWREKCWCNPLRRDRPVQHVIGSPGCVIPLSNSTNTDK